MVIVIGWGFINPANHTPFIPGADAPTRRRRAITHPYGGIMGILGAAGVVFFAFIGFDAVSTAAQEAKNPKRDMPIGILGSLVVCTILYVLFSYVLSGVATVEDFRTAGQEASVAVRDLEVHDGYEWLSKFVTVAILAGFSSVILVMLLGQSRVFYSMSHDGLVPKVFSEVHPTLQDAVEVEHAVLRVHGALRRRSFRRDIVGEMTSIGTLFAFILVCAGVWIMRVRRPDDSARLRRARAAARRRARHRRLRRDDLRPRLDQLAAARRLAGDRPGVLFRVRPPAQPAGKGEVTARRLDGTAAAAAFRAELTPRVAAFAKARGRPPSLSIVLAGDNPASQVYVRNKERAGVETGLEVNVHRLPAETPRTRSGRWWFD